MVHYFANTGIEINTLNFSSAFEIKAFENISVSQVKAVKIVMTFKMWTKTFHDENDIYNLLLKVDY